MKAKYLFSGILAAGMLFTACNDELDIEKKGNLGSPETYYTTDVAANAALAALHANVNRWWGYGLYDLMDNLSDDMYTGGGSSTDYNDKQLVNAYCFSSDNPEIKNVYNAMYINIYDANLILTYVAANENLTPVMKRAISEAYFFRGITYMYLAALWGNAPLVTTLLQPSECTVGNAESREAVYEQAISDLKQAVATGGLATKKGLKGVEFAITNEVATAYLGKAQVYAGKYSEAASTLASVINSGKYDLDPVEEYENLLNNRSDETSSEVMWVRYVDPTSTAPQSYDWSGPQNSAPYYEEHVMRGFRNDLFDWQKGALPNGMECVPSLGDIEPGYGECNPRATLYNDMKKWETENGGDLSRLNATMKDYDYFVSTGNKIGAGKQLFGNEGFFFWKNRFLAEEVIGNYGFGGWNVYINSKFRFMRYAEVLLLAAEAYFQSGNVGAATTELNKVRTRAHETALGTCTFEQIKQEKRFELCIEGCRFIDMVRWGDAASLMANQGKSVPNFDGTKVGVGATHSNGGFQAGKHELLPYPATELLVNPNIAQNPGWAAVLDE